MKRIVFVLFLVPQLLFAQYRSKCFTLEQNGSKKQESVRLVTNNSTEIPIDYKSPIYGLSVTGSVTLDNNQDCYVRITLKDDYNYEYLIYECYPLLADDLTAVFDNTAIETVMLDSITPQSLCVEVKNAMFNLDCYSYLTTKPKKEKDRVSVEEIQKEQCQYIADLMNQNLEKRNMTWRAKVTSLSTKTYEEKKDLFGGTVPELYGFDYYAGGIFIFPSINYTQTSSTYRNNITSQYVSEWDWRNRHGKNWITSVKNQFSCGSCWAFSAISVVEAYVNLYYNRLINYDLSEQELISCNYDAINGNFGCNGGNAFQAFGYIKDNGIVKEADFPYYNSRVDCGLKESDPDEIVYISNYHALANDIDEFHSLSDIEAEDLIKSKLLKSPISFGILPWNHIINLIGYTTLEIGDEYYNGNIPVTNFSFPVTPADSSLIGRTAWLVKNSWWTTWGDNGYGYIIVDKNNINLPHYIDGNISCNAYSDSDVAVTDADGDGYFFWGIGPKPSFCPSWVPDEPDGDDSNPAYGPMNQYGFLEECCVDFTISSSTTYSTNMTSTDCIDIAPGATLTISGTLTQSGNGRIRVLRGGTLIIDGGTLQNADLKIVSGSIVIVRNNGKIHMASGKTFDVPQDAVVNIQYGDIE